MLYSPFLSVWLSGIKRIYTVVHPSPPFISRTSSSSQTETRGLWNSNSSPPQALETIILLSVSMNEPLSYLTQHLPFYDGLPTDFSNPKSEKNKIWLWNPQISTAMALFLSCPSGPDCLKEESFFLPQSLLHALRPGFGLQHPPKQRLLRSPVASILLKREQCFSSFISTGLSAASAVFIIQSPCIGLLSPLYTLSLMLSFGPIAWLRHRYRWFRKTHLQPRLFHWTPISFVHLPTSAVPNLSGNRDQFHGSNFSTDRG